MSAHCLYYLSSDNNRQLVKTLLDQIEHLKKELTCKNTIILCLDKNGKPFPISDQKSSDNSNSCKVIENSSQNQNEDAYLLNNNVNDVSINTAEECTSM